MQVVIGYSYIVANGSFCFFFFHPDSRLDLSQHGRFHAVSLESAPRDTQTLICINWSQNVSNFMYDKLQV